MTTHKLSRRGFMATSAAVVGTSAVAQTENSTEVEADISAGVQRNISSFRSLDWQPYFSNLNGGAILVDIQSRALHYWSADETVYKLYPTSARLGVRPHPCANAIRSGQNLSDRARIIRLGRTRFTCHGRTTAFTARTTRARSGAVHPMAASACIMNTSQSCLA